MITAAGNGDSGYEDKNMGGCGAGRKRCAEWAAEIAQRAVKYGLVIS
jgi:hypothetical protein